MTPEEKARQQIDTQLTLSGWAVQDYARFDLLACCMPWLSIPPRVSYGGPGELIANIYSLGVVDVFAEDDGFGEWIGSA